MAEQGDIVTRVRRSAGGKTLFLPHAVRQMSRPDRMITIAEVRRVIRSGELVEDYPSDPRGHSCLLLGYGARGRAIHVVCSPKEDYVAIIAAYLPNAHAWEHDFKTRKRP